MWGLFCLSTVHGNLYYYLLHNGEINTDLILIAMRLNRTTRHKKGSSNCEAARSLLSSCIQYTNYLMMPLHTWKYSLINYYSFVHHARIILFVFKINKQLQLSMFSHQHISMTEITVNVINTCIIAIIKGHYACIACHFYRHTIRHIQPYIC